MLIDSIFLILGFAFLIKGANWLVDGSASIAKRLQVSSLVIGLTVVAFGTSAPELIVNIFATLNGSSDIAVGNILGSNISNIFLVLGISAMIYPLSANNGTIWKEIPLGVLAIALVLVMANDQVFDSRTFSELSRIDGIVLMSFFVIFIYYVFGIGKVKPADQFRVKIESHSISRSILMTLLGVLALAIGGQWIIDGATGIASSLNISEAIVGLTAIALGTSLPELATSATAALKKDADMAIGNVVGSNIFNLFWVLGITSFISPLSFSRDFLADGIVAFIASLGLFILMIAGRKKRTLERWEGVLFVLLYVFYIIFLLFRSGI